MVLGVVSKSRSSSTKGGCGSFNISSAASIARSQYNLGSISGTSSSRHIHRFSSSVSRATGHATTKNVLLNPTGILRQQRLEETDYLTRTEAMSSTQLEQLHAATVIHDDYNSYVSQPIPCNQHQWYSFRKFSNWFQPWRWRIFWASGNGWGCPQSSCMVNFASIIKLLNQK